ncbi:hypothetical protein [Pseudoduganella chitinolytica]|uniref:HEAT repeat domain-containing protein n=1 Tax=Pseudoduganella chitinolytica TaxID=34070 RepID=A0ABY8B7H0_9BURK|nr:hypothetical protein [Pseudoduganella chitinolytica]WEF31661.1 hypothetical protein PX653_19685 [Pseudoduganella chitinolytica]
MNVLAWLRGLRKGGAPRDLPLPGMPASPKKTATGRPDQQAQQFLAQALARTRHALTVAELSQALRGYSGYVREAALARCVELRSWDNLPDMVERLNDWVPQVRNAAQIALKTLLTPETVPQMVNALPAVHALLHKSRVDHGAWVADFGRALLAANAAAVIDGVRAPDTKVRRACFELLVQQHTFDATALIERILRSRIDNVLASRAVELCSTLPAAQRPALYELALASPYPTVRAEALRAKLTGEPSPEKDRLARAGLLDLKSHARAVAGQYLSQQGKEVDAYYRELLAQPAMPSAHRRVAIAALGALSNLADATLFRQQADDAHPLVRHAALAALLRAAPQEKDAIALRALQDSDPQVRGLALHAVTRQGAYMDFDTVARILEQCRDIPLLQRFASIEWLVAAVLDQASDTAPVSRLVRELRRWRASPEGKQLWSESRYGKGWLPAGAQAVIAAMIGRVIGQDLPHQVGH